MVNPSAGQYQLMANAVLVLHGMSFVAPPWVFIAAYSAFCLLVAGSWVWLPPRRRVSA